MPVQSRSIRRKATAPGRKATSEKRHHELLRYPERLDNTASWVFRYLLITFGFRIVLGTQGVQPTKEEDVLAIAGTGYGLIGLLVIILLVVLIFYFIRRA